MMPVSQKKHVVAIVLFCRFLVLIIAVVYKTAWAVPKYKLRLDANGNFSVYFSGTEIGYPLSHLMTSDLCYFFLCNHIYPCRYSGSVNFAYKLVFFYNSGYVTCVQLPRYCDSYTVEALAQCINTPYIYYGVVKNLQFYQEKRGMFNYANNDNPRNQFLLNYYEVFSQAAFYMHGFFITTTSPNYPFSAVIYDGYLCTLCSNNPSLLAFFSIKDPNILGNFRFSLRNEDSQGKPHSGLKNKPYQPFLNGYQN
ncbi:hypothetical protein CI610_00806 [invertebrate metagenome]|uniref:Uncharacterized protein n=1 Tax=invertebrate metagenome TaxID=1711999 RepID=A0A2H9TAE9_9ZZZZ